MKELEDYNWFPSFLRNYQTEFIGFVVAKFDVYNVFVKHLNTMSLQAKPMLDLCSGSGQPAIYIFKKSNCFTQLILSDKYPNSLQFHDDKIVYEMQSTNVLTMHFDATNYYTLFNSFHHFTDDEKIMTTQKIYDSGATAFFVEILEPTISCFFKVLFMTTIGCLLLSPFVKPFSLKRLFFTYIIPVNILSITYDGIVSVLKSRSVKQYQKLFSDDSAIIEIFKLKNGLSPLIVFKINNKK